MAGTAVDRLHQEFGALTSTVSVAAEPSLAVTANDVFRKALLLSAASEFEVEITRSLQDYVEDKVGAGSPLVGLVRTRVLSRQYHTFFTWDKRNVNSFFSMFGQEFKRYAEAQVAADAALADGIVAFLELGEERNMMVHQGFSTYSLNKTSDEVFAMYQRARVFVERVPQLLASFQSPAPQQ